MADEEERSDDSAMPLIEHLVELRGRLMWSIGTLIVAFIGCYLVAEEIYAFLVRPLTDAFEGQEGRRLIFTGLHEAFFTYLKVSFFAAFCLSIPVILGQIWAFIAPGLFKREKRAFLPFLAATPILFHARRRAGLLPGHSLGLEVFS